VEVRTSGSVWVPALVVTGEMASTTSGNEYVGVGSGWTISRAEEGKTWRWVYRDLSGYVPPGGGK
jgi:hypothetical protein